jgi:hypothetical protein
MRLGEIKAIVVLAKMQDGSTKQVLVRKELVDPILTLMLFNGGINILQEKLNIEIDDL